MAQASTAFELFSELAHEGVFTPADQMQTFQMPTLLEQVPSFVTYGTPDLPVRTGVYGNARLERHT